MDMIFKFGRSGFKSLNCWWKIRNCIPCFNHVRYATWQNGSDTIITNYDRTQFGNAYDDILSNIPFKNDQRLKSVFEHVHRAINHLITNGQFNRGLLTVAAYKVLTVTQSEQELYKVYRLGWCIELLNAILTLSDDLVNNERFRSGKPHWHSLQDVGQLAIVDLTLLDNYLYYLLRFYFSDPNLIHLFDLFRHATCRTMSGRVLDFHYANRKLKSEVHTIANYANLCRFKTAPMTYNLSMFAAMLLANVRDVDIARDTTEINYHIGELVQTKNDFMKWDKDRELIGNNLTDVEEGKFTWLIATVFQRADEKQKRFLSQFYGLKCSDTAPMIYQFYDEHEIAKLYDEYEWQKCEQIKSIIRRLPSTSPIAIYEYCMDNCI